ncbi:MAG: monovalent cation/H+ antiporter complex subunit F [bacterium]|nr:cation:proton antiporter [Candidatus Margulisiibacteriota bacterium]
MSPLIILINTLSIIAFFSLFRIIKGPTHFDRLIGLNLMVANTTAIIVAMAVHCNHLVYLDVAMVYAILGFVSVIAISKYLTGRELHR